MAGTKPTIWAKKGVQRRPESVTQLLEDIANITVATSHRYVWRGLKSAHYLLHSSLHRRLLTAGTAVTSADLVQREILLLEQAKNAGFNYRNDRALKTTDLLAYLQHAGASTPLLDVTPDPFIGLFFATEPVGPDDPCALVAIRVGGRGDQTVHTYKGPLPDETPTGVDIGKVGIYEVLRLRKGLPATATTPILWEAPFVDDRMRAQRGMFLATTAPPITVDYGSLDALLRSPEEEQSNINNLCDHNRGRYLRPSIIVFYIGSSLRKQVARELDRRFGYRTETIYPDLAGFALANAANRSFSE